MAHPVALALAGLMALTAITCLGRAVRVPTQRPSDVAHAGMAAVMVAMLVGRLGAPVVQLGLVVSFGGAALWFARTAVIEVDQHGVKALATGDGAWLSICCSAMLAMLVPAAIALPAASGMPAMGGMHTSIAAGAVPGAGSLAGPVVLLAAALLAGLALVPRRCPSVAARSCQVAMGLTMAFALVTMAG